eukprot:TRINITY_DN7965_c0_g1_i3.p2 TRINITY_DN7965_c0_g1~~TRINITY_DN7965_c0_g1_i3.p2  ORF type:complete len:135 (+),score=23.23 TRINITY_DN7965_c0_g1_i3:201-605(+)
MPIQNFLIEPQNTIQISIIEKDLWLRRKVLGNPEAFRPLTSSTSSLRSQSSSPSNVSGSRRRRPCTNGGALQRAPSAPSLGGMAEPDDNPKLAIPRFLHVLRDDYEEDRTKRLHPRVIGKPWVRLQQTWGAVGA